MMRHRERGRGTGHSRPGLSLPLTRRRVVAGALGVAGSAAIGAGLSDLVVDVAAQNVGAVLTQPQIISSENGLLTATLYAMRDLTGEMGGVNYRVDGTAFGRGMPGPTLRVSPGDRIKLRLENSLGESTNVHFHGLHVSPLGHSDNIFVDVK